MMSLLFLLILLGLPVQATQDPEAHIQKAKDRLKKRDYEGTTSILNHLMREHKRSPQAIQAKIVMGDMFFQKQEWDAARVYYQQFLKDHLF